MRNKYTGPAILILTVSFAVSIITLIIYFAETGYSDESLLFLLTVIRYSSFMVCLCSVYLLIFCIVRIIRKPSFLSAMGILLSFCSALYGAGIIIIDAFIISFMGGNG